MIRARIWHVSAVLTFAASVGATSAALAQATTTTTTTPKSRVVTATIDTADVVYVSGDDAVLRLPDGSLRLLDVPAGTTFLVDGKPANVADLQPGHTLSHAQVNSRTESQVTTVTEVSGTVTAKSGRFLTLRLDDGTSKIYRVPMHATFTVNGQNANFGSITRGSRITATAVKTEGLSTVNTGAAMHAQTPPQSGPLLIEK